MKRTKNLSLHGFKHGSGTGGKIQPKRDHSSVTRKREFEDMICEAIKRGVAVELRYRNPDGDLDTEFRMFAPAAVYISQQEKFCVSGVQIVNPHDLHAGPLPRNFEIGRIVELRLTDKAYPHLAPIEDRDKKYGNGIICRR